MNKESIQFYKNGQWTLRKAWGSSIYDAVSHGKSPFKDHAETHQAKTDILNHFKKQNLPMKNMENLQSGIEEPHVLLHRGMPEEDPNTTINPAAKGPNMLDFSNGKTVKTTHNHVSTSNRDEAEFYSAKPGKGNNDDFGHHLSYWVPISSVYGNGKSIDKDENSNSDHHLVAPGEYQINEHHKYGY